MADLRLDDSLSMEDRLPLGLALIRRERPFGAISGHRVPSRTRTQPRVCFREHPVHGLKHLGPSPLNLRERTVGRIESTP